MKRPPMFMDWKVNIIKIAIIPKQIYQFEATPNKIPAAFKKKKIGA